MVDVVFIPNEKEPPFPLNVIYQDHDPA